MSKSILALDPGNSTGWCFKDNQGMLQGGTLGESHEDVAKLITRLQPDILVYETFKMYPGKAQSLYWNSFYPCEVIGVIKYVASIDTHSIRVVGQQPSVKKYAGPVLSSLEWKSLVEQHKGEKGWLTEHVKDAYQHLRYYERNPK